MLQPTTATMTKTQLLYLATFDALEDDATVIACQPHGDTIDVILDRTVFYPGGGGQPADSGELLYDDVIQPLQQIWLDDNGMVVHRIAACPQAPGVGTRVHMRVDASKRRQHCRLHSAGHVIDLAVSRLGYDWQPTKGAHFPDMAFVEYESAEPLVDGIQEQLQTQCDALIDAGSTNTIMFLHPAGHELASPSLGHLDAERIVAYDDFRVACGGTHVSDIAAIGSLTINKVKRKKGVVKVSYGVDTA